MASERYNAPVREKHWQKVWEERGTFRASEGDKRPKCYILEMFPYPSGRIHVGHSRNYTIGDVLARYKRAKGFNVLHPMGWDAFGLPAENAAMERKVHPAKWTYENIAIMKRQLQSMGLSIDWSRELATCDPSYYKHQQKLFLDFLKKGLAYRKSSKVNWDPVEHTVLANEQVIDGRGWRSGALVEQRELTQWFFKITKYGDDLLDSIETLDKWPERVRLMQANWIGRSEGLTMKFALEGAKLPKKLSVLEIFTTRHDTIFGASFMAISPEHPLAQQMARGEQGAAGLHRGMPAHGHQRGGLGARGEAGLRHRAQGCPPVQAGRQAAGLRRQFHPDGLRHRRHLRLPRRTTSATSISLANTGSRSCPWCCRPTPMPPRSRWATSPTWATAP